jgi:type I restriction enzyme R subunit
MPDQDLTEQQTRQRIIDKNLARMGWKVDDLSHVIPEFEIPGTGGANSRIRQKQGVFNPSGFSDYLLLDRFGEPLAVVEAKKTSREPRVGKEQAEEYADGILKTAKRDPLIFLSNGYETWFWNRKMYPETIVSNFFSRDDLEKIYFQNQNRLPLTGHPINTSIIDRDYQQEAVRRVCDGLENGKRKFLLVMATGTGKTRTAMALIDVLLKAKWAKRVLFLVDREALAQQAMDDGYKRHLPEESRQWVRSEDIDQDKRLYVATLQTMASRYSEISPAFFDLIIADECHRSIYNKWKDVLAYFYAIKVGLTATPAEFVERDTFQFFECQNQTPTFNFTFEEAIHNKCLVDFRPAYSAQTQFQKAGIKTRTLTEEQKRQLEEQGIDWENLDFEGTDIEKKVIVSGTNEALVQEFMDKSIKDDSGTLPGKSILFAVSHDHAMRLMEIFNRFYPEHRGHLAQVIDSKVERALSLLDKFKSESFPRVAISVDMLDTGVDVREAVNLIFAKPIFSKIKFWQMIGRGTRTLDPKDIKPWCVTKDRFLILDHWGNFEYFNMKPDGETPSQQPSLPMQIFRFRLAILRHFQGIGDLPRFEQVKNEILADIKSLPRESVTVHEHLQDIDIALSDRFWVRLDGRAFDFLNQTIAPLMRFMPDINIPSTQFTLRTERLALAVLLNDADSVKAEQTGIVGDVLCLPLTLSDVRQQEQIIQRIRSGEAWRDITYDVCVDIRNRLSALMRHKRTDPLPLLELDLDDVMAERKWIQFGPQGQRDYVERYRENVEKKVLELANTHPALQKLKADQALTEKDFKDLEDILTGPELYISEDNLRRAYARPFGTFIQFLKSILGKYKFPEPEELINEAFQTYVIEHNAKKPFNAEQLRFLRAVKNVFAKKRHIDYADFFEPPFTQLGANAATRLFSEDELKEIVRTFNSLKV